MKNKQLSVTILSILVIIIMIIFITPERLLNLNIKFEIAFILILLFLTDLGARTIRWWILFLAQTQIKVPLVVLILPLLSSSLLNIILPARAGEIVRLYSLKRSNDVPLAVGLSVIVVEQMLNLMSLVLVMLFALGGIILSGVQLNYSIANQLLPVGLLGLIVALFGMIVLLIVDPIKFIPVLKFFPSFINEKGNRLLKSLSIGLKALKTNYLLLISTVLFSMAVWIIEGLMILILAFNIIPPFSDFNVALLASNIANLTFMFPVLPGAIGEYEAILAIMLTLSPSWDLIQGGATAVGFIDRIIKTGILVIIGGYSTVVLGVRDIIKNEIPDI